MEKLADNLQKLGEDDLLQVVEMVHNNKTAETYTKNDVERTSPTQEPQIQETNTITRGRISRRPIYPPRQSNPNALGFLRRKIGIIASSFVTRQFATYDYSREIPPKHGVLNLVPFAKPGVLEERS